MRGRPAADGVAAPRGNSVAGGGAEVDPAGRLGDEPAPRIVTCTYLFRNNIFYPKQVNNDTWH